jgi:MerR family transcriptional regulator, light-induced transcriptional regulator
MQRTVSPRQLAAAIGVSESSLKRWADDGLLAVVRTAGGHRRISLPEAVRFIRHMGFKLQQPTELGLSELRSLETTQIEDASSVNEAFGAALEEGNSAKVRAIVEGLYLSGWSVATIIDGPIRQTMARIGTLWQHADWGIMVEHRATELCLQTLSMLRHLMPSHESAAPIAVGGAGPNDPYMLPSLACSITLAEAGWTDVNLGPRTPTRVLANAVGHYKAKMVWIAFSHSTSQSETIEVVNVVSRACEVAGAKLIVGGPPTLMLAPADIPGVTVARSMLELSAFGRGLHAAASRVAT